MELFCTSRNTNPNSNQSPDHTTMVYLGTSLEEATECVDDLSKYEKSEYSTHWPTKQRFPGLYTALPAFIPVEYVKFYFADGYWCSIVKCQFEGV